jgi:hypothetical protein
VTDRVKESEEKSRRQRERFALPLPVRVHCRESADYEWHEMSHLKDVTPFGARLRLKRPTEEGPYFAFDSRDATPASLLRSR